MAVGAVWCELVSGCESLIDREIAGKRRGSDISSRAVCATELQSGVLTGKFPAIENREICPSRAGRVYCERRGKPAADTRLH